MAGISICLGTRTPAHDVLTAGPPAEPLTVTPTSNEEIQVDGATGAITITVGSPPAYAGTYVLDVDGVPLSLANLGSGPQCFFAPTISVPGAAEPGQTAARDLSGLWIYRTEFLEPSVSLAWQADAGGNAVFADLPGATGETYLITSAETGDQIRIAETMAQAGAGSRAAASPPLPVAGASIFTDDFTRTDGPLDAVAQWTEVTDASSDFADLEIFAGEVRYSTTGQFALRYRFEETLAANQYCQITCAAIDSTISNQFAAYLLLRYLDDDNHYYVDYRPAIRKIRVRKRVAGVDTLIGDNAASAGLPGDVVRAEANGSTLRVLINGAEALSVTDASLTSGQSGLGAANFGGSAPGSYSFDNWECGVI